VNGHTGVAAGTEDRVLKTMELRMAQTRSPLPSRGADSFLRFPSIVPGPLA
jgi:hypothetical protein